MARSYRYFYFPDDEVVAIARTLALGETGLAEIDQALTVLGPRLLTADARALQVCRKIGEHRLGLAKDVGGLFAGLIFPIEDWRIQSGETADELITAAAASLADSGEVGEENEQGKAVAESIVRLKPAILKLLDNEVLITEAKARSLLRVRPNRAVEFRIIPDLRPLLSEGGSSIDYDFNILLNTIQIEYLDQHHSNSKFINISVNPSDLDELSLLIAQARENNKTIAQKMTRLGMNTLTQIQDEQDIDEGGSGR